MDSRDLSQVELLVELVGEKINAQVSAHEKYSLAFIKILDTLDTIIEQQDEITSGDTSFYKKLIEDIESLSKDIRDEDEAQKNWRDSLLVKFDNFVTVNDTKVKDLQDKIEACMPVHARVAVYHSYGRAFPSSHPSNELQNTAQVILHEREQSHCN